MLTSKRPRLALTVATLLHATLACSSNIASNETGAGGNTAGSGGSGSSTDVTTSGSGGNAMGTGGLGGGGMGTSGGTSGGGMGGGPVGTGGAGGAGGSAPQCPGLGDTCTNCLADKCAARYCSCYGNLECGKLSSCFGACAPGEQPCFQACLTAHQDGISSAYLLGDCGADSCTQECPKANTLKPCQECLFQACDIQMNACYANVECLALYACVNACGPGDMACRQACLDAHPGGVQSAKAVNMCANASCANSCN